MSDVLGTIYGKGKDDLQFSAKTGAADKATKFLKLRGNVRVRSVEKDETLTAQEIDYDADSKVLTAIGNVRLTGHVGTIGTFSKLMATSDFKLVGTPDLFPIKMKAGLVSTAAALAATGGAVLAQSYSFVSPDRGLSIRFGSFSAAAQPDGSKKLIMAKGVDATSQNQGLRIKSDRAEGVTVTVAGKTIFRSVVADGSVELVKTAKSPDGARSTTVDCAHATYQSGTSESTIRGEGGVHVLDRDPEKHQVLDATGSTCTATVLSGVSGKQDPLRALTLAGSAHVHVEQAPETAGAKPGTLVATSDSLTYEGGAAPTLTLRGHVLVKGTGNLFSGITNEMPLVVLNLDGKWQVKSMYAGGER
jgi:hypothetical protein